MTNRHEIIGVLTENPAIKANNEQNSKFARLNLRTDETFTDNKSGEIKTISQWHNVVVYSKYFMPEVEKLQKDDVVRVVGKVIKRKYQDKNNEQKLAVETVIDFTPGTEIQKMNFQSNPYQSQSANRRENHNNEANSNNLHDGDPFGNSNNLYDSDPFGN